MNGVRVCGNVVVPTVTINVVYDTFLLFAQLPTYLSFANGSISTRNSRVFITGRCQCFAEKHRHIDSSITISLFKDEFVGFMKQARVEYGNLNMSR